MVEVILFVLGMTIFRTFVLAMKAQLALSEEYDRRRQEMNASTERYLD